MISQYFLRARGSVAATNLFGFYGPLNLVRNNSSIGSFPMVSVSLVMMAGDRNAVRIFEVFDELFVQPSV